MKNTKLSTLLVKYRDDIAFVILNRPDKKNAMSLIMMQELIDTAKAIRKNPNIRAVILAGNEHCFCSGIDLKELNQTQNKLKMIWEFIKPKQSIFQETALIWREIPIPVIAVIEGHCLGAGMQLALAADFRIAYPNAIFSILEGKWGIIPDMGIFQTTQNLITQDVLRKYIYSATFFNSQEALEQHFITQVSEQALEEAISLAFTLKYRSPDMITAAKDLINQMLINPKHTLRKEKIWQLKLLAGKNQPIAIHKNSKSTLQFFPRQYK